MFKFSIEPMEKKSTFDEFRVYSLTEQEMLQFMNQHNINVQYANIQYVGKMDDNEDRILQTFKFQSNLSNKIYEITTCQLFVNNALQSTCDRLSDYCVFGSAIFRDDIPFIKLIQDLIEELPHAIISDYALLDGNSVETYDDYSWDSIKDDPLFKKGTDPAYTDAYDYVSSTIYDSIYDHSQIDHVQPVTLEAYVRAFTESIMRYIE